ncbi:glycosylated lysosomal membrane protein B-like [Maniola hyperantus]|uniref:glycosylated lysosomal membrane protein B-like n=1 Tax=Aphantopus hyperantus TaxID=2795564 RepID=UPI001568450A|nr:glycosylated lysosomal membrane protein B-like [Maniola hyperantus]XP_034833495.1 glycosylated lysosomal membrane protein B-like [Maniola hyperantus]
MQLQVLFIIALLSFAVAQDRKITPQLNPGCRSCNDNTTLVYVKCQGPSDTIHQIWDFTRKLPTVMIAVASFNSTLNIIWGGTVPVRFDISPPPSYSFATALDKLYEYDDLDDNGHFDPKFPHHDHKLDHLVWHLNNSRLTEKDAMVQVYATLHNERDGEYGTVGIKLDLLPYKDYATELPHLIHTANSTLFDISLVNLTTTSGYNASRYALHLVLASTDSVTQTMHYTLRKSLDDEHTPGVFEVIEIKSPALYNEEVGGYLQFRPVGYVQPERGVASSTVAHVSCFNRTSLPRYSTLRTFFDDYGKANLLVQDMMVSFGEPGDGYYRQHNYTAWSFSVGYGAPPTEKFSWFVVLIISLGLGVPVLLALSGVAYVLFRRHKQTNSRTRFENED